MEEQAQASLFLPAEQKKVLAFFRDHRVKELP
jgi:hypothetical protein